MITKKDIPFHKPHITEEEISEVVDSMRGGWLTMGPKTIRLEEEFVRYTGSPYAVAVNSCTAALHLALKAVGIGQGDEVIIPDLTFTATGEVVCYMGAKPVIADVDRDTGNIDLKAIERALTPRTKAIIPVHFAGQPCDMDEIMELARARGLHVIEDAAHALPAWYKGRKVGTIGDATCFSFYATKTMTTGEGGMIMTADGDMATKMRALRLHGISRDAWKRYTKEGSWFYEVIEAGYKYNMTDIQAAIGLPQLKKLEWMWERRCRIAGQYDSMLADISDLVRTPKVKADRVSAWHLYVIELSTDALRCDRAVFMEELKEEGVSTSVHFIPLHKHPFYRDTFRYEPSAFPVSEKLFAGIISLPIYTDMSDEDVCYVAEAVKRVALRNKR